MQVAFCFLKALPVATQGVPMALGQPVPSFPRTQSWPLPLSKAELLGHGSLEKRLYTQRAIKTADQMPSSMLGKTFFW